MSASTAATRRARPFAIRMALVEAFRKLSPRDQLRNPVMFTVYVGSVLATALAALALVGRGESSAESTGTTVAIAAWLWATVLFANLAEALAEGRGKAQAANLRRTRRDVVARRLAEASRDADATMVPAAELSRDDIILVEAGEVIPGDGEVVEGIASVDESAITGESAPVIRESGGDRSSVTGGTRVLSDWLIIRIAAGPGESFLDRMIALVEGAKRQKTPNEIALDILLASFTIIFLLACATLLPLSMHAVRTNGAGSAVTVTTLVALLVCLIPTTIGGLLSAIRIAGMDRLVRANVIATSGRAVEAAGDVDVLLLDKTGTVTYGNRLAARFVPAPGVTVEELADAAQLASLADETPEGRSIVLLAKRHGVGERTLAETGARFVPFTAQTRMSGISIGDRDIRKGAFDAIERYLRTLGGRVPDEVRRDADSIARVGATPLVVAEARGARVLGTIELRDIVKVGLRERFAELRAMGIRTVMVTGDNPLTAAAIAADAGIDDFLAEATPERKLELIREEQRGGRLVAMTGDGTNDAPALAQADVAVAMSSGTQAAKEAGNMVDLDSDPTKLIEIVRIGKELLMTRGALTTFSIANDVAKYFAILPAAFLGTYPELGALNLMRLEPSTAILSSVIFNALIIVAIVPIALRGVRCRAVSAATLLRDNILVFGVGGLVTPFVGIKLIDMLLNALPFAALLRVNQP